jgi:hypothetical protein
MEKLRQREGFHRGCGFVGVSPGHGAWAAWSAQCTERVTRYRVYAATVSNRAGVQVWPHRLHVQLMSGCSDADGAD